MITKSHGTLRDEELLALLQCDTLELHLRLLDLGAMIDSIIAELRQRDGRVIEHSCRRRIIVRGDEAQLRIALGNLLQSCAAGLTSIRTSQHGRRAAISILAPTRHGDGHWAALELVRKIADAHGGSAASATLEDAVRFCVVLPAASAPPRHWPPQTTLLVVDDHLEQVVALSEVIRLEGLGVEYATSAAAALELLEAKRPSLVVADLQLPDLDGAALIKRARQRWPDLPAALLTGYPREHPIVRAALASGRSAYLGKPVSVDALFELVAEAVGDRTSTLVEGDFHHDEP